MSSIAHDGLQYEGRKEFIDLIEEELGDKDWLLPVDLNCWMK